MNANDQAAPDNVVLAQRIHDMARVAGRIAHDFDNILTGVIGFAELAQPLVPPGNAKQHLTELQRVGQQGVELTKRLHQLGRAGGITPGPTPLARVLAELERRVGASLPAPAKLEIRPAVDLPLVRMDAEAIRTALSELLLNAVEACGERGSVRVDAAAVTLTETECRRLLGRPRPGPHVVVTIADSGPGLSQDVRSRLFVEACFTTKPRHRGLGLAIVYRILHAHQAGLALDAPPEGGTAARVYLPVAEPDGKATTA